MDANGTVSGCSCCRCSCPGDGACSCCGCREVRVPYEWLWNQSKVHMTSNHDKSPADPMNL
jgi:hypothetical protein